MLWKLHVVYILSLPKAFATYIFLFLPNLLHFQYYTSLIYLPPKLTLHLLIKEYHKIGFPFIGIVLEVYCLLMQEYHILAFI